MPYHTRIARPVSNLERTRAMYCDGLGLSVLGSFTDHEGFDGVMLGAAGADYHFEFTICRTRPVHPAPTPEDLAIFYLPAPQEWQRRCTSVLASGFTAVASFNPYWDVKGRTFADHDGYRIVLQNAAWTAG